MQRRAGDQPAAVRRLAWRRRAAERRDAYNGDESVSCGASIQERVRQAEDLRRVLGDAGASTRDLNDIINQLREFDSDKLFDDPKALEQLQAAALDRLKKFDFDLRKKLGADNNQLALVGIRRSAGRLRGRTSKSTTASWRNAERE